VWLSRKEGGVKGKEKGQQSGGKAYEEESFLGGRTIELSEVTTKPRKLRDRLLARLPALSEKKKKRPTKKERKITIRKGWGNPARLGAPVHGKVI